MPLGYEPDFIGDGITIPLPKFSRSLAQSVLRRPDSLRDGIYSDERKPVFPPATPEYLISLLKIAEISNSIPAIL